MKKALLTLMRSSGVFAGFREANKHKILILTYHRFVHDADGRSTSAAAFEGQLEYLKKHYQPVSLSQIQESFTTGATLPERAAAVTIDDGFDDAYEIAFPILRKYSVPATLFVITDFANGEAWLWTDKLRYIASQLPSGRTTIRVNGRELDFDLDGELSRFHAADVVNSILKKLPNDARDAALEELAAGLNIEVPPLPPKQYGAASWEKLCEMDKGGIEIGSHTVTHPILPNLSDDELRLELTESRSRLETALNRAVTLFCYPNGSYDDRTRRAVQEAGYKCAVTTVPALTDKKSDPLTLSRIPAELDIDRFIQSTCGFEQLKSSVRSGLPQKGTKST